MSMRVILGGYRLVYKPSELPGESGDSVCYLAGLGESDILTVVGGF
jgi:hypothetical protein